MNLLNKSIFLTVVRRYIEKEMNNSMNRWLASYEARRTRGADMSSKGLLSSRFDLEGLTWDEIRDILRNKKKSKSVLCNNVITSVRARLLEGYFRREIGG